MTTDIIERLPKTSATLSEDGIERLREIFPGAFRDGRIDFDVLRRLLGDQVDTGRERFGLQWPGKADCLRVIQDPSVGTLLPMRDESVNFDSTENVIIDGDNLEVLKLLQKSYYGKVKLIYIDPPYNTGNEFIYPDNFREGLQDYLKRSEQVDGEGFRRTTNTEIAGRFHSKWLSMMWPRLFLARNLLRDDGFMCVSISDHEAGALRFAMDEILGEENFVAQLVWKSRQFPDDRSVTHVSVDHEYILVYSRRDGSAFVGVERDESKFANPDNDPRGLWMSRSILGLATREQRPNLHYPIKDPATGNTFDPPASTGWRYGPERMNRLIQEGCILFPKKPDGRPREKKFRAAISNDLRSTPSIITDVHTSDGTKEIREMFGFQAFDFPKPTDLVRRLVEQTTAGDDVVLDFFAGSGTTGHAVMVQNANDGGKRRYVLVQLPEASKEGSEVEKRGLKTIAAICKERLRIAGAQIRKTAAESLDLNGDGVGDTGFRSFKLAASNFKPWDGDVENVASVAKTLELFADHVVDGRSAEDILTEILVRSGFPLTAPVARLTLAGKEVYSVGEGAMLVCLDRELTLEVIEAMVERTPAQIVCLDAGFQRNDQLKVNAVQAIKSRARSEETTIVLRVV